MRCLGGGGGVLDRGRRGGRAGGVNEREGCGWGLGWWGGVEGGGECGAGDKCDGGME